MAQLENENNSRRNFLKVGFGLGIASIATFTGAKILASGMSNTTNESSEKVKVLTPDGKLVEVDRKVLEKANEVRYAATDASRKGLPGKKFAMVIDLSKCKNARACVEACQGGHHLPAHHEWMKVYLMRESENTAAYWMPRPCFHCDNPMCVSVCPVGATYKRSDGIVLVDNQRCIGCKFCMTGCPYSVRVFNWKHYPEFDQVKQEYSPETNTPGKEGTVGKCVFCADLLRKNELPRCVQACPMGVIYFGDLVEDTVTNGTETLRFSQLVEEKSGYRFLNELGTQPSVYYLPPVKRIAPVEQGFEGLKEEVANRYKNFYKPNDKK